MITEVSHSLLLLVLHLCVKNIINSCSGECWFLGSFSGLHVPVNVKRCVVWGLGYSRLVVFNHLSIVPHQTLGSDMNLFWLSQLLLASSQWFCYPKNYLIQNVNIAEVGKYWFPSENQKMSEHLYKEQKGWSISTWKDGQLLEEIQIKTRRYHFRSTRNVIKNGHWQLSKYRGKWVFIHCRHKCEKAQPLWKEADTLKVVDLNATLLCAPRNLPRRNENICALKDLRIDAPKSIIHNSQKVQTAKIQYTVEYYLEGEKAMC